MQVLRSYLQHSSPHNPGRLGELLAHIPEVIIKKKNAIDIEVNNFLMFFFKIQAAASLLLESKMFYVPFVLNSASIR